jgi:hypothetical protein
MLLERALWRTPEKVFFWMLENLWAFWEFYSAKKFWADDKGRIFFNSAQKISL